MTTIDDFLVLVRHEIGLPVGPEHADVPLDQVPGWDSMHLLALLTALERQTGRSISLPDVLEAESLHEIHELAVQS
ncbi:MULTISPECIES: phosphopantetheine-binding protein [Streptomyces]|uniref:ACP n=2 Tax=Streptomyces TaxID=1883 RepID=A0A5P9NYB1_STROV|nr:MULTISPECIES: phosphopantetheine-binding protein [Streptomyces]AGI99490.1 ACP [Streptomyces sp. SCSIO 01127]AGC09491.1 LobC0 [Streptomyces sp. FXJ7.023]MBF8175836.1 acyl carrier protein [Streptomyces olivaceus]MBZ6086168.1 acyl carrier protein [Streptomyces olivaceus]MBZ6107482.1 acyl carrier protein [Streptomyces olivaceus]